LSVSTTELEEMLCKLDATENPRLFKKFTTIIQKCVIRELCTSNAVATHAQNKMFFVSIHVAFRPPRLVYVSVCVCMYTHMHWHTHTSFGLLGSEPRDTRHLESPKNPDRLNLCIHVSVCVYEVHMYMCMLGKAIKSGPTVFLLSSRKQKHQDANALQKHRVQLVGCNNGGSGIS